MKADPPETEAHQADTRTEPVGDVSIPGGPPVDLQVGVLDAVQLVHDATQRPDIRPHLVVHFAQDGEAPINLPISADTSITKNSKTARGTQGTLALRDNRYCQVLIKPDLKGLHRDARVKKATFRFTAAGCERSGQDGTISFHRMLRDWDEGANWFEPSPNGGRWDGLRKGKDYETGPFAVYRSDRIRSGEFIEVEGFERAVNAWWSGAWKEHGFVMILYGKVLQVNIPSREAFDTKGTTLCVGGQAGTEVVLRANVPQLRRILVEPGDLLDAALKLKVQHRSPGPAGAAVALHRMLREIPEDQGAGPRDYDPEPMATHPLDAPLAKGGVLRIDGLAEVFRRWADGTWADRGMLVKIRPAAADASLEFAGPAAPDRKQRPALGISVRSRPKAELFDYSIRPREGVYVTARGSRLYYGDRRVRFWGVCRHATDDFTISRLRRMGFNSIRMWGDHDFYDDASAKAGKFRAYTKGDGSGFDKWDRSVAQCKKAGLFVMCPSLHYTSKLPKGASADGSFISGGADWDEWRKAVAQKKANFVWLKYFDERARTLAFTHAANFLDHVNPYTGKRNAEEEVFCIFENHNENGFLKWPLERGFKTWPPYFRNKLRKRWNEWLRGRYGSQAKVEKVWGRVEDGESLREGSIALAPISTERNTYPEARGSDFLRFLVGLVTEYNESFRAHCRRRAATGVGVNVAPFLFDTQYRNNTAWLYVNSKADVNSFGMYIWSLTSSLTKPPSLYVVDSSSLANRPAVLYEVNQSRPNPCRTEFPFKLAALASIQDWDGIFWHYWHSPAATDEGFVAGPLPIVLKTWADGGIYHANDPVMCSALALAGQLFLAEAVRPASRPTVFRVGRNAPFKYKWFNGISLRKAAFGPGAHIEFDPEQDEDLVVDGRVMEGQIKEAVAGGEDVLWDWPNGRLIIDAPTAKAYVGPPARAFRFRDGIVLRVGRTEFVSFALVSADGRPLAGPDASRRMLTHAMSDARNTGFDFDWSVARVGGGFISPSAQAAAVRDRGRAPVVVDRVPYALEFPTEIEAEVREYDFALRRVAQRRLAEGNALKFAGSAARWMSVVEVIRRGRDVSTTLSEQDRRPLAPGTSTAEKGTSGDGWPAARGVWNPIKGLGWHMSYVAAHQYLRDFTLPISSVGREDPASGKIVLGDAELILGTPGDVEIRFRDGRMAGIAATLTKPMPFEQASIDLQKVLGEPAKTTLAAHAFAESTSHWVVRQKGLTLSVTLKEHQGTMGVEFSLSE